MAIATNQIKLEIGINRGEFTFPVFVFKDFSDYTSAGEDYTQVKAAFAISLDGVPIYDNLSSIETSPDINGSSLGQLNEALYRSNTIADNIELILDEAGKVVDGIYTITYHVLVGGVTLVNTITVNTHFNLPKGKLVYEVDLNPTKPFIKVIDETNYVAENVTPTGTEQITLYYPQDSEAEPTVVEGSLLKVYSFYVGNQVARLESLKNWNYTTKVSSTTFASGNYIVTLTDKVTDREDITVSSENTICSLFCCIKEFTNKALSATTPTEVAKYKELSGMVSLVVSAIDKSYSCGKTGDVELWIRKLKELVSCDEDCGCDGTAPILITSLTEVIIPSFIVTDGVNTVSEVEKITFSGATVSGSGGQAVVTIEAGGGGSGTVTEVTGVAPISVASGTTTPEISIELADETTDGYLSKEDYAFFNAKQEPLVSGTNIKTVNGTVLLGSGNVPVGVTSVTGSSPIVSSGGAAPNISMPAANASTNGYLSSTDWSAFNNKQTVKIVVEETTGARNADSDVNRCIYATTSPNFEYDLTATLNANSNIGDEIMVIATNGGDMWVSSSGGVILNGLVNNGGYNLTAYKPTLIKKVDNLKFVIG